MLPVYICEDDAQIRSALKVFLEKQILIQGYDMEVVLCSAHPQEILDAAGQARQRGIYFLDVELKGEALDGFGLGQKIREFDSRGFLIYVTAFKNLAFETFRYHLEALDYIYKENPEKMYEGIARCLAVITERVYREVCPQREYFTVRIMDVVKHVPLDEILYFETAGRTHRIELHAVHDRMDFIGSIQELEKQLAGRFLRVHRACLVNLEKIAGLDLKNREIHLDNGEKCIFSRTAKKQLLDELLSLGKGDRISGRT